MSDVDLSQMQHPVIREVLAELKPPPRLWAPFGLRLEQIRQWGVEPDTETARGILTQLMAEHQATPTAELIERPARKPGRYEVRPRASVVYYVRLGSRVKIGTTTDLRLRLQQLQPEQVLALEPGGQKLERSRHAKFRMLRVSGEWFRYEQPLTGFIANLPRYTGPLARYLA